MRRVRLMAGRPPTGPPPPGDGPIAVASGPPEGAAAEYVRWLARTEPDAPALKALRSHGEAWRHRPLISVVMPVYEPRPEWLAEALASVTAQSYGNWELCVADDHSSHPHVHDILRDAAADPRVRVTFRGERGGISTASNSALELARGDHVALLDHDDVLRPHALHRMVEHLHEHPGAGLLYSDEDKLLLDGTRGEVFFKPDWSPDLLLSCNYLCHLSMIRRDLVTTVGGFRPAFDGSQDHDLFLRVAETACEIVHVADVLYSWRQVPGSAALSTDAKPYAHDAGMRAIAATLARRGVDATVNAAAGGWYHVRYAVPGPARIGIIIPTHGRTERVRRCVESILSSSTDLHRRIVIVAGDGHDGGELEGLDARGLTVMRHPGIHSRSAMVNRAARELDCDHLVLIDEGTTAIRPGWLEAMLEHSRRPDVGAVGGRLVSADGTPRHEGISLSPGRPEWIAGAPLGLGRAIREVAAVSWACLMIGRERFEAVGGLDEGFRSSLGDVDLCLRLGQRGHRTIYTPIAELRHDGAGGPDGRRDPADEARFAERWGADPRIHDPYTNRHVLTLSPFRLRVD